MAASIPFIRDLKFEYGRPDQISPLIRRVVAKNPSPFTYAGTGTYIIGHGSVAVIDPGPDLQSHMDALMQAIDGETVSHILITHSHIDHCEAVPHFQKLCGAKSYAFLPPSEKQSGTSARGVQLEEGVDKSFKPDVVLSDGEKIQGKDWTIDCLHTPGHMSNHLCFALAEEKTLFTGDHVMGWSTTVIVPPDGNMHDYMKSLYRLQKRDDDIYVPTHGAPITDPQPFIQAYIDHRIERENQILTCLGQDVFTISDMVARMYADVDSRLHAAAAQSVKAHLIKLMEEGRVTKENSSSGTESYHLVV